MNNSSMDEPLVNPQNSLGSVNLPIVIHPMQNTPEVNKPLGILVRTCVGTQAFVKGSFDASGNWNMQTNIFPQNISEYLGWVYSELDGEQVLQAYSAQATALEEDEEEEAVAPSPSPEHIEAAEEAIAEEVPTPEVVDPGPSEDAMFSNEVLVRALSILQTSDPDDFMMTAHQITSLPITSHQEVEACKASARSLIGELCRRGCCRWEDDSRTRIAITPYGFQVSINGFPVAEPIEDDDTEAEDYRF